MIVDIAALKYDEKGLIPAVVQDARTNQVLMMAWMNQESLEMTLSEGRTCFWSRSRQELWRKGETSGNTQWVVSISADCDGDTLLVKVIPDGPACHLGTTSCFENLFFEDEDRLEQVQTDGAIDAAVQADADSLAGNDTQSGDGFSLDQLYALLQDRQATRPEGSYTSYLFQEGLEKILKKVGEESTEVIIAAMKEDEGETVYEIGDLAYHLLVLMVEQGISPDQIRRELASRHVIDHKEKQKTSSAEL